MPHIVAAWINSTKPLQELQRLAASFTLGTGAGARVAASGGPGIIEIPSRAENFESPLELQTNFPEDHAKISLP